jgi:hypothetical protein
VAVLITAGLYILLALEMIDFAYSSKIVPWLGDLYTVRFTAIFMIGGLAALYAGRIPCDDRLGVLALIVYLVSLLRGGYLVIGYPAMVYLLLWLAWRLPAFLRRIGAANDYSYGVYLYGFLVQQLLAYAGVHHRGFVAYTTLSVIFSYLLGAASWHLLEKRALALKDWGPGKGLTEWGRLATKWLGSKGV